MTQRRGEVDPESYSNEANRWSVCHKSGDFDVVYVFVYYGGEKRRIQMSWGPLKPCNPPSFSRMGTRQLVVEQASGTEHTIFYSGRSVPLKNRPKSRRSTRLSIGVMYSNGVIPNNHKRRYQSASCDSIREVGLGKCRIERKVESCIARQKVVPRNRGK